MSIELTADEAWLQATTFEQRLAMMRGKPVEVTLTHEQFEAIENDPIRRALREALVAYTREDA